MNEPETSNQAPAPAPAQSQAKPVSAFALFPKSWEIVKNNFPMLLAVSLPTLALSLSSLVNSSSTTTVDTSSISFQSVTGFAPAVGAILFVAVIVAQVMLTGLTVRLAKGEKTTPSELWEMARKYTFPLIGLGILSGIAVLLGLILLIVPGLIMIRRYILAPYVMLDQGTGVIESMKRSAALSKPFSWSIWGLIGVTILLNIPAAAFFGVAGSIIAEVLSFIYIVAPALRYVELKKLSQ